MKLSRVVQRFTVLVFFITVFAFSSNLFANGKGVILVLDPSLPSQDKNSMASIAGFLLSIVPPDVATGIIIASNPNKVVTVPKYGWYNKTVRTITKSIGKTNHKNSIADFEKAFNTAIKITEQSTVKSGVIIAVFADSKKYEAPEEMEFIKGKINKFHALQVNDDSIPLKWSDLILDNGGKIHECGGVDNMLECLLETFMDAIEPQQFPLISNMFHVDSSTTAVTLIAIPKKDDKLHIITPDSRHLVYKNNKLINIKTNESLSIFDKYFVVNVKLPKAGAWALTGVVPKGTAVLASSRQYVDLIMPRIRFAQKERIPIAAAIKRDNKIIRLGEQLGKVGFSADLLDEEKNLVKTIKLDDNGTYPDEIKNDGIYSGFVDFKDSVGEHNLRAITSSRQMSRFKSRVIEILPGDWAQVIKPSEDIILETQNELILALRAGTFDPDNTLLKVWLGRSKPIRMKQIKGVNNRWRGMLPVPKTVGARTLHVTKNEKLAEIVEDSQSINIPITVVEGPPKYDLKGISKKVALICLWLLVIINGIIFLPKLLKKLVAKLPKRKKKVVEEEVQEEVQEVEEEYEIEEEEYYDDVDEVRAEEEQRISNVMDRISSVTSAHKAKAVKADIDRPDLKEEDLDRDADPDAVSGTAYESRGTWLEPTIEVDGESDFINEDAIIVDENEDMDGIELFKADNERMPARSNIELERLLQDQLKASRVRQKKPPQ